MKRRYFVHFEITANCMQAGVRSPGPLNSAEEGKPDVFDNLAAKLRANPHVAQMLAQIGPGENEVDKVIVGVGREYEE